MSLIPQSLKNAVTSTFAHNLETYAALKGDYVVDFKERNVAVIGWSVENNRIVEIAQVVIPPEYVASDEKRNIYVEGMLDGMTVLRHHLATIPQRQLDDAVRKVISLRKNRKAELTTRYQPDVGQIDALSLGDKELLELVRKHGVDLDIAADRDSLEQWSEAVALECAAKLRNAGVPIVNVYHKTKDVIQRRHAALLEKQEREAQAAEAQSAEAQAQSSNSEAALPVIG